MSVPQQHVPVVRQLERREKLPADARPLPASSELRKWYWSGLDALHAAVLRSRGGDGGDDVSPEREAVEGRARLLRCSYRRQALLPLGHAVGNSR